MKKAIFPMLLLLVSALALSAQSPRHKVQSRKSKTPKVETPCLTRVPSPDELLEEIKVEWAVATTTSDEFYYYNTRKMLCEKGILKIWVKTERIGEDFKRKVV